MFQSLRTCALATPLLLAACASIPDGPSIASLPGDGKSFDQFRSDDFECRQYAASSTGGTSPSDAQADSVAKSAVVGTAVGALAGAALGGRGGVGAGAGVGLLAGALAGSAAGNRSGYTVQQRYDNAYVQCMYAKGDKVPVAGPVRTAAPRYYVPASPAPVYYNPPPPPAPGYASAPLPPPPPPPGR